MSIAAPISHPFLKEEEQAFFVIPARAELTVAQVADIIELSESSVLELLDQGELKGRWEVNRYLIDRDSLRKYEEDCRRIDERLNEMASFNQAMGWYDMEPLPVKPYDAEQDDE